METFRYLILMDPSEMYQITTSQLSNNILVT